MNRKITAIYVGWGEGADVYRGEDGHMKEFNAEQERER